MKRAEAADILRERAEIIEGQITNESSEFAVALKMGAAALVGDEWISCSDRLPPERKEVLIYDGAKVIAAKIFPSYFNENEKIWWAPGYSSWDVGDITHWRPLLEPPEEEGKI